MRMRYLLRIIKKKEEVFFNKDLFFFLIIIILAAENVQDFLANSFSKARTSVEERILYFELEIPCPTLIE